MSHVLITGGARRIGAALARHHAALGWNVTIHYHRSSDAAADLARELGGQGASVATFRADLARWDEIDGLYEDATAAYGPVDLLLNNASSFMNDDLTDLEAARVDDHLDVNLKAPLRLAQRMVAGGAGDGTLIVNMLDNKVDAPNPDFLSYTISKAALASATALLAMRLEGRPRVCGIAPSITLISGAQNEANFEKSARINPLGRRIFPHDIARAVDYLREERGLDGEILTIDGGQTLLGLPRDVAFLVKEGRIDAPL